MLDEGKEPSVQDLVSRNSQSHASFQRVPQDGESQPLVCLTSSDNVSI